MLYNREDCEVLFSQLSIIGGGDMSDPVTHFILLVSIDNP